MIKHINQNPSVDVQNSKANFIKDHSDKKTSKNDGKPDIELCEKPKNQMRESMWEDAESTDSKFTANEEKNIRLSMWQDDKSVNSAVTCEE